MVLVDGFSHVSHTALCLPFPLRYDDASNPTEDEFTCIMVWGPNIVRWWVKEGLQDMDNWRDATDIAHLEYAGNTAVPDGGQAQWRINLWQYQNGNPAVEQHVNIPSFQFQGEKEREGCALPAWFLLTQSVRCSGCRVLRL